MSVGNTLAKKLIGVGLSAALLLVTSLFALAEDRRQLVDPVEIDAFVSRLVSEPPPMEDAEKMHQWLSRYGKVRKVNGYDNYLSILHTESTLSGGIRFEGLLKKSDPIASDVSSAQSRESMADLEMLVMGNDETAARKIGASFRKYYGEPLPFCENDIAKALATMLDVWKMNGKLIVAVSKDGPHPSITISSKPWKLYLCPTLEDLQENEKK